MKIGDKVKVINIIKSNASRGCLGKTGTIKGVTLAGYDVKFSEDIESCNIWWFYEEDLELIKEEDMKYKLKEKNGYENPITLSALREKNPCANKFAEFVKLLILEDIGYAASTKRIPLSLVLQLAEKLNEVQWLIDNDFIEEINPVFYKIGDRFDIRGVKYILAQPLLDECCLINLKSGNRYDDLIRVKNIYKITIEEFKRISSNSSFIKIGK